MAQSKLLKVTGILFIIFSAIGLISGAITIINFNNINTLYAQMGLPLLSMGTLILGVVVSLVELAAGLMGVQNWKAPEKVMSCIILGGLVILLSIVSNVISFTSGTIMFNAMFMVSLAVGYAIPVLYMIGAFTLKSKGGQQPPANPGA